MAEGAAVRVYVSAPLCAGAETELARRQGRAGDVRVESVCLPDAERSDGSVDLARVGENARRATRDVAAVGFLADPSVLARRASQPIVEAAGIVQVSGSGQAAMGSVLDAIEAGGGEDPRQDALEHADS